MAKDRPVYPAPRVNLSGKLSHMLKSTALVWFPVFTRIVQEFNAYGAEVEITVTHDGTEVLHIHRGPDSLADGPPRIT